MLAAALLLAAAVPAAPATPAPPCHIYAVIHHVFVRRDGRISHVDIDRVIDPAGAGTEQEVAQRRIDVEVPAAYILAVRALIERQPHTGNPPSFFTYTFYNPLRPNVAQPDPGECGPMG